MKLDDTHDEIGALLRSQKPRLEASPGLETRILRELDRRQRPAPAKRWLWFALPPALAAITLVVLHQPERASTGNPGAAFHGASTPEEPAPIVEGNPLRQESLALSRDARRAGRFLIDCLPSAGK
jgi:hypothetical protein